MCLGSAHLVRAKLRGGLAASCLAFLNQLLYNPVALLSFCSPRGAMKLNSTLLKSTVVAALGGLLFGFDTVVIAGAIQPLKSLYHLSPFWEGFTVAAALVGTVVGSMLASIPGDSLGRRGSLRWMAILYVVSAAGCAFAWNWSALVLFRFIGGLGIGGSSVLGPMYIAEISPARWRGRLVGCFQFNEIGRAHVLTPVTDVSRMPSSA